MESMESLASLDPILAACRDGLARGGRVLALTGAGVSAESGIPTFRGKEGYWTIGAREYHPQELATRAAFQQMPWSVWAWYLYRRGVCRRAQPNAAHHALVRLAAALPERFALVTQNVDGLHRRAGSPDAQTFPIHGDITQMRCAADCTLHRWSIPESIPESIGDLGRHEDVPADWQALLVCPRCGGIARPHVLWFDEYYDEPRFHVETVRSLAQRASLLVIAGTSASTNLPWQVVQLADRAGAVLVDVNTEDNPFGEIAARTGGVVRASAATALPAIVEHLVGHAAGRIPQT
ncbi:MAG TPA: Sir2 family NAD-dependent protein deacetylase [Kofleriaceae bacterium]|nr:Sir2 family NAD-dependent protein deacetylase [Kofleriaceae bacterium]